MNVKLYLLSSSLFFCSLAASAQRSMQAEEFPLGQYEELTDTKPHDSDAKWAAMKSPVMLSWASTDVRYGKHRVPHLANSSACTLKAWRGERVNAQAVLWTNVDLNDVELTVSDLRSGANVIPASKVRSHFVRYVMTDELNKDGKGGCGCRENKAEWDSSVVADALDINKWLPVQRKTAQPLWVNVWVPEDAKPGTYTGTLTVRGGGMDDRVLKLSVQVLNRTLALEPRPLAEPVCRGALL